MRRFSILSLAISALFLNIQCKKLSTSGTSGAAAGTQSSATTTSTTIPSPLQIIIENERYGGGNLLSINADLPDNTDSIQVAICSQSNPDSCKPSRSAPGSFALGPKLYPVSLTGTVVVSLRACLGTVCGTWVEKNASIPASSSLALAANSGSSASTSSASSVGSGVAINSTSTGIVSSSATVSTPTGTDFTTWSSDQLLNYAFTLQQNTQGNCQNVRNLISSYAAQTDVSISTDVKAEISAFVDTVSPEACEMIFANANSILLAVQNEITQVSGESQATGPNAKSLATFIGLSSAAVLSLLVFSVSLAKVVKAKVLTKVNQAKMNSSPPDALDKSGNKLQNIIETIKGYIPGALSKSKPATATVSNGKNSSTKNPVSADNKLTSDLEKDTSSKKWQLVMVASLVSALGFTGGAIGSVFTADQAANQEASLSLAGVSNSGIGQQITEQYNDIEENLSLIQSIDAVLGKREQAEVQAYNALPSVAANHTTVSGQPFTTVMIADPQVCWGEYDTWTTDANCADLSIDTNSWVITTINHIHETYASINNVPPRAVIINGDLTAFGWPWQWIMFKQMYFKDYQTAIANALQPALYPGLGNHDYANNVGNCWGPWTSIFTSQSNWCAKNSVKTMNSYLSNHASELGISNIDPNSLAYSWDIENIHFVQLHNYPIYDQSSIGIGSAAPWLKQDLDAAQQNGKKIILNWHDSGEHWSPTDPGFQNAVTGHNISAVFVGHYHSTYGPQGTFPIGSMQVPLIYSSTPGYNRLVLARFLFDSWEIYGINTQNVGNTTLPASQRLPSTDWHHSYQY